MRSRGAASLVIFLLLVVGISTVSLRLHRLMQVQSMENSSLWRLTYRVEVDSQHDGAKIQVAVPTDTLRARVFRENLSYGDLQAERSTQFSGTSLINFSTDEQGLHVITAQFDLEISRKDRSNQFSG